MQAMDASVNNRAEAARLTRRMDHVGAKADNLFDHMLEQHAKWLDGSPMDYHHYQHAAWYMLTRAHFTVIEQLSRVLYAKAHREGWLHPDVEY